MTALCLIWRPHSQPLEALLTMLGEQQSGLCEFLDGQRMKVLAEKVETERRVRLGLLSSRVVTFRACHLIESVQRLLNFDFAVTLTQDSHFPYLHDNHCTLWVYPPHFRLVFARFASCARTVRRRPPNGAITKHCVAVWTRPCCPP